MILILAAVLIILVLGGIFRILLLGRKIKILETKTDSVKTKADSPIEQLLQEKQRLKAIIDSMSEAVIAMDTELKLLLVNEKAQSLFSISEGPHFLLESTRSVELEEAAKKVLDQKKAHEFELKQYKSGQELFFQGLAAPLGPFGTSGSNDAGGIVIVLNDMTKLKKLEQIRKDFAANVSHELRTPIQIIKGFSETLLEQLPEQQEQLVHGMGIISKNALIMENLTNDLLNLVSLEDEGNFKHEIAEFDIKKLLDEALLLIDSQKLQKNIHIKVFCTPELRVKLYGPLFIQALVNILDNAIKYSPASSKIWVDAYTEEAELVIKVRDKGIGIPSDCQERIFERFYRVNKARSRDAGGTGLGLAIVKHIIQLHKGRVEVESHAGEGSVFTIRIPLS